MKGKANIPLDSWPHTNAELGWQNIELATLAEWWPRFDGFNGKSSGILPARKVDEPRPLEALLLQSKFDLSDATIPGAKLGNCEVVAYAGPKRFLITKLTLKLADGTVRTRANFSRHNDETFTHINGEFEHLALDQLVHIFQPEANKVAGYLTGKVSAASSRDLKRLTGNSQPNPFGVQT